MSATKICFQKGGRTVYTMVCYPDVNVLHNRDLELHYWSCLGVSVMSLTFITLTPNILQKFPWLLCHFFVTRCFLAII